MLWQPTNSPFLGSITASRSWLGGVSYLSLALLSPFSPPWLLGWVLSPYWAAAVVAALGLLYASFALDVGSFPDLSSSLSLLTSGLFAG